MAAHTAEAFFPASRSLRAYREAARDCRACPLWKTGTQTVFGEGPAHAPLMLVGEQPGNEEDLSGHPFVGPAGRMLDEALEAAGLERGETYVTNVVKHFKWEPRGKRRIHKRPLAGEIGACAPWLEAEIELVRPELLVALGATAAQALFGRAFRLTQQHGLILPSRLLPRAMATIHPSAVLRQQSSDERRAAFDGLVADLRVAADAIHVRSMTRPKK
jgi:DNA polymerase